ncbi:EscF/YscF/HrpA family type III secretion system needle major subunit [Pandoraea terrae]|uniref:EscF/YscF/HrpA family type III secretion system needle major subunit n=1 Tax=Pandoraea terrae TaxID=1537710 RepID=A0A5E4TDZ8_9BURK|nr:type III secretion system needle filament subunit SctF [Pandoraea terrae]VVD84768.1 EscF/YscF/HrpA family type III secretion system needle major subunit [Pandoraea terrae]
MSSINASDTSTGYMYDVSKPFVDKIVDLQKEFNDALEALKEKPSDPSVLARFQAKLADYTTMRQAQSSTVKALKDTSAGTISNTR